MPTKAKASPDDIMPPAAIRSLLKQVRADGAKEVNCAIGLPEGDKTQGVILLDRIMGPKKLGKHLAKAGEDAGLAMDTRSIRFGKATTAEHDDTVLLIKVNKEPAGDALHKGIKKRVKLAGFTDVVFSVDEQLNGDAGPDEAEHDAAGPAAAPVPAAPPDQHALSQRLAHLIKRLQAEAAGDPARLAALGGLARQANALLKTGSPNEAAARMDRLEAELGTQPAGPDAGMEAFRARLAGMLPGIKGAPQQHAGTGAADAKRLDVLASEAGALAKAGDFAGASSLLDQIAARFGDAGLVGAGPDAPRADPFQVFVRSLDGVTLTITLPDAQATTIAHLQKLIEDRTGIAPGEQNLSTGTKPFNSQHAALPVAEYGMQRNQTLSLLGQLKGGFGERAAIADAILKNISHGNVLGDIQATKGQSKAKKDFCRSVTNPTTDVGKKYLGLVADKAVQRGLIGNTPQARQRWLNDNRHFIKDIAISSAQAGNCGDYSQIVYSHLMAETENQFVYQVVMTKPYDHQFVVTSPDDHGTDINALIQDRNAMVADAWWSNKICMFKTFVEGENPYGDGIPAGSLKIVAHRASDGKRLDDVVAAFAKDTVEKLYKAFEGRLAIRAGEIDGKATTLAEAAKELDSAKDELKQCREDVRRAQEELDDLDADCDDAEDAFQTARTSVKTERAQLEAAEYRIRSVQKYLTDIVPNMRNDQISPDDLRLANQELSNAMRDQADAQGRLDTALRQRDDARADLDAITDQREKARDDLSMAEDNEHAAQVRKGDAKIALGKAEDALPGVFGAPDAPWDEPMSDIRNWRQLCRTIKSAYKLGGVPQLEKELRTFDDADLVGYAIGSESRADSIFKSGELTKRFQSFCQSTSDENLKTIRDNLTARQVKDYILPVAARAEFL